MPITIDCSACSVRHKIPDELYDRMIRGRRVTIGCKRCGADIVIDGTAAAGDATQQAKEADAEAQAAAPAKAAAKKKESKKTGMKKRSGKKSAPDKTAPAKQQATAEAASPDAQAGSKTLERSARPSAIDLCDFDEEPTLVHPSRPPWPK